MAAAEPGYADGLSTDKGSLGHRIAVEQLKLAYGNLPNSFAIVPASVLVITLLELTERSLPVYWFEWCLIAVLISAVRYHFYREFGKVKNSAFDYQFWANRYSFGIMSAGLFWGITPFALFHNISFTHRMFLTVLIIGLATGVSYAYAYFLRPARFYMAFSLLPLIAANFREKGAVYYSVATMSLLYLAMLLKWLKDNNRFGYEGIKTALEKGDLAEKLGFSEAFHRAVITSSPDTILLTKGDGKILMANIAAHKMLGYTERELKDKNLSLLLPNNHQRVLAEGFKASPEGLSQENVVLMVEAEARMKSGGKLTVECASAECVLNYEKSFVLTMRDVSERKKAEVRIHEAEARYRQFSEASFEGIAISVEGKILDCNSAFARMFGYSPGELMGRHLADLTTPESLGRAMDHIRRESEENYQLTGCKKNGTLFPVELQGRKILYHDQKARITAVRDITARMAAEEGLRIAKESAEEATRLKDKFVSLVAHDLRSPFTTILGYLQILRTDKTTPLVPHQEDLVERVVQTSHSTLKMVNDLLNISRLQSGKMVLHSRFITASHLADLAISAIFSQAEKKGVKLVNDLPADLLFYGDFPLLQELFHNLASNAVKFCRKGDVVRFHSPSPEEGVVAISDTGIGIDPKILPDLFRHEVKTSTYGTAEEPGTGFGLPLCGDIVRMHGGSISAESEPGRGSTFYIRLPQIRPSVLIVDDDHPLRLLVARLLAPLGCTVREASNGAEAMRAVRSSPPHVIISDLQMPDTDGYGLLAELQKDPDLKKIPVIIMTGLGIDERSRAFELGAADFIAKPIDAADLVPRVKHFIGG